MAGWVERLCRAPDAWWDVGDEAACVVDRGGRGVGAREGSEGGGGIKRGRGGGPHFTTTLTAE